MTQKRLYAVKQPTNQPTNQLTNQQQIIYI